MFQLPISPIDSIVPCTPVVDHKMQPTGPVGSPSVSGWQYAIDTLELERMLKTISLLLVRVVIATRVPRAGIGENRCCCVQATNFSAAVIFHRRLQERRREAGRAEVFRLQSEWRLRRALSICAQMLSGLWVRARKSSASTLKSKNASDGAWTGLVRPST